ncbi:Splicing factor 45 [Thoreauomyces humboldtii]|nr:Splicing factor 45 [Thoreauomyces humboldtii]
MASLYAVLDAAAQEQQPSPSNADFNSSSQPTNPNLVRPEIPPPTAPPGKKKIAIPAGWSALQPVQIKRRPPPQLNKPPRAVLRDAAKWAQAAAAPAVPLVEVPTSVASNNVLSVHGEEIHPVGESKAQAHLAPPMAKHVDKNAYDPARPNDYLQFKDEMKRKREVERRRAQHREEVQMRGEGHDGERSSFRDENQRADHVQLQPPPPPPSIHAEPMAGVASGEEAYMRRMRMAAPSQPPPPPPLPVPSDSRRRSSTPTSETTPPYQQQPHPSRHHNHDHRDQHQDARKRSSESIQPLLYPPPHIAPPTPVVLLTNMVGGGEVDADLEGETAAECGRFGKVLECVVFEVPYQVPDDEAVRIFVRFEDVQGAIRAQKELNGRFFGGRTVAASFFDPQRFRIGDLD